MGFARSLMPLILLALGASACSDVPTDETPRGTVRLFLAAMERGEHDGEALHEAYDLLSAPTRRDLQERAHLATSFGADQLEPWEMLVVGGFRQTFTPARMREQIDGDAATVVVTNAAGDRRAEVPLVRESGRWRLVLALPPARE